MPSTFERALEVGLRIRPNEKRRTAVMAAYAANAIGAVVVGRSVRDALYLGNRPAKGLAAMYVLSSVAIVLVSWLYSRIADRVPRGALNSASALVCAAVTAIAWMLLVLRAGEWVYPSLYIFVEAMGSLVVIQFWTLANDVFHAREAKRLFGIIGGGGTLANVVFGLLVSKYAKVIGTTNLLWIVVVQLCLCALLAKVASAFAVTLPLQQRRQSLRGRAANFLNRAGLASVFGSRHLVLVAAIAAASAATVTVVDFQFKIAAAESLHQNDLAGYFGKFYGICGGIALGIQIWVTGRVLERYGILASLLPLPVSLALGSSASAIVPHPGLFVQSLAKGSDTIFRYTINDASMQLLYVPVATHIRGRAKAFIDGVLKPSAVALTGVLLYAFKAQGGEHRSLTWPVLAGAALWAVLLFRARNEYVQSLVESLERRHLDLASSPLAGHTEATVRALRAAFHSDSATVLHALTLLQHGAGVELLPELRGLLGHESAAVRAAAAEWLGELKHHEALEQLRQLLVDPAPEVRASALGAVCALQLEDAVPIVLPFLDPAKAPEAIVRAAAAVALIRHAGLDGVLAAAEPLKALLAAQDPRDRAAAADALGNIGVRGFYRPLLSFLRDPDPSVRRRAIAAAGKLRTNELIPQLVHAFLKRETALEAASALTAFGPGVEQHLMKTLLDEEAPVESRRGIALVLGRLGTREAAATLVSGLPARSAAVRKGIARALSRLARRAQVVVHPERIELAIRSELGGARAALAAQKRLRLSPPEHGKPPRTLDELLALSLLEERDARILQVLTLLEVLLPNVRLDVVAENLRSELPSARGNALEVLDNALPEPWKRLLMAALDEVKRRGDQVLADPRPLPELVSGLVSGEAGEWVAACAVKWADERGDAALASALQPALRTALESGSAPLREVSAVLLARSSPPEMPKLLGILMQDPSEAVRRTASRLLGRPFARPMVTARNPA